MIDRVGVTHHGLLDAAPALGEFDRHEHLPANRIVVGAVRESYCHGISLRLVFVDADNMF
jgi:hypothetical protein